MERSELEIALARRGHAAFRARQVFRWIQKHGVTDAGAMTNLSRDLRQELTDGFAICNPHIVSHERSSDGTEKFMLSLADERRIESVFIPDTPAMTFCLSTQVGCAMGCTFCLTGKMGLVRNLTAGEIAGQVRVLAGELGLRRRAFNLVFMGMGEPLHNYDETMKAFRILSDEQGFGIPARRITISTVGILPELERLAQEPVIPNLAISLHAPTDALRGALVPLNRKYGISDVIRVCQRFPLSHRRRITFEYVLLAGVNDSPDDARTLSRLLAGVRSKVNLIPLNAAAGIPYDRPSDSAVSRFARELAERGVAVSVRKSRGRDIRAACGQLVVDGQHASPAQQHAVLLRSDPKTDPFISLKARRQAHAEIVPRDSNGSTFERQGAMHRSDLRTAKPRRKRL
jgi:23S rRNA (adenine2503-C2)-methyltransferase